MGTVNLGLGLLHIATGVFFTTTGCRKCFLPDVRAKVCAMFDRFRMPKWSQYAVIAGELLGGLGLLFGFLTHLAAFGLLIIMIGAYDLDTWPTVKAREEPGAPLHKWISNALCTPEAQLIVITATIGLTGAGAFSMDALIFGGAA